MCNNCLFNYFISGRFLFTALSDLWWFNRVIHLSRCARYCNALNGFFLAFLCPVLSNLLNVISNNEIINAQKERFNRLCGSIRDFFQFSTVRFYAYCSACLCLCCGRPR